MMIPSGEVFMLGGGFFLRWMWCMIDGRESRWDDDDDEIACWVLSIRIAFEKTKMAHCFLIRDLSVSFSQASKTKALR